MAAFDPATLDRWRALAIVDRDGTTVGTISEFYLDRETGYPTWALVNTGLFGATQTFVPLVHANEIADGLQVPYEKSHIKDSPRVDLHDELSPAEEATLFAHYGVEYQPSTEPPSEGPVSAPGSVKGPGPVPAEPGTVEGPGPVSQPEGSVADPGPVPAAPGAAEGPGRGLGDTGSVEGTGPTFTEAGSGGSADIQAVAPLETGASRVEPEPFGGGDDRYGSQEAAQGVPDEPGTAGPDDVTLVTPGGFGSPRDRDEDPDLGRNAPPVPASEATQASADPGPSRTAPVEPGLPGSTAASPGPVPTTIDKDSGGDSGAHEAFRAPDEPGWVPDPARGFDTHDPADRPVGASDRWREAKLAAERNRIERAAASQQEERSPLERARRRLERLVGGGHDDPDEISPADRDAAERARRARLGLDEDDPHSR